MQRICYLEDARHGHDVPPGFRIRELSATAKSSPWARWLGKTNSIGRIVYLERCRLSWDDLELVSFVPQGSSRGALCWCDLFVQLDDPARFLGELGTEDADGQWAVTRESLEERLRPRMVAALEAIGSKGDWGNEAYWPTAATYVAERLSSNCPAGIVLDRSEKERPACVLRKVRSFEQCIEERMLREEFRVKMQKVLVDGTLAKAILERRVGELLANLGEERVAQLLTPAERAASADQRVSSYIEVLGPASGSELRTGVVIGNFQLQSKLGRGGMGEVWKAWDTKAERPVVLKLVPPEMQHAHEEMARVKATFQRIHALNHQHICPTYLLDEDRRFGWYVVMKYIDGQTLSAYRATYMARHGAFPLKQVVKVLRPVAEALDYAHSRKVVHRDIKPENILVQGDAEDVQLVDFGLAAEIRTSVSRLSQVRMETSGTRPYMAPEQWRGDYQDHRTDQYALAVVAYELLSGHLPFDSDDFDILRTSVLNDPSRPIAGQPEAVNQALMLGLAKPREERYRTCQDLVNALSAPLPRRRPTLFLVAAPAALFALLLIVVFAVVFRGVANRELGAPVPDPRRFQHEYPSINVSTPIQDNSTAPNSATPESASPTQSAAAHVSESLPSASVGDGPKTAAAPGKVTDTPSAVVSPTEDWRRFWKQHIAVIVDQSGESTDLSHLDFTPEDLVRFDIPRVVPDSTGPLETALGLHLYHLPISTESFDLAIPLDQIISVELLRRGPSTWSVKYATQDGPRTIEGRLVGKLSGSSKFGPVDLPVEKLARMSIEPPPDVTSRRLPAHQGPRHAILTFVTGSRLDAWDFKVHEHREVYSPGYGIPVYWWEKYQHNEHELEFKRGETEGRVSLADVQMIEFGTQSKVGAEIVVRIRQKNGSEFAARIVPTRYGPGLRGFTGSTAMGSLFVAPECLKSIELQNDQPGQQTQLPEDGHQQKEPGRTDANAETRTKGPTVSKQPVLVLSPAVQPVQGPPPPAVSAENEKPKTNEARLHLRPLTDQDSLSKSGTAFHARVVDATKAEFELAEARFKKLPIPDYFEVIRETSPKRATWVHLSQVVRMTVEHTDSKSTVALVLDNGKAVTGVVPGTPELELQGTLRPVGSVTYKLRDLARIEFLQFQAWKSDDPSKSILVSRDEASRQWKEWRRSEEGQPRWTIEDGSAKAEVRGLALVDAYQYSNTSIGGHFSGRTCDVTESFPVKVGAAEAWLSMLDLQSIEFTGKGENGKVQIVVHRNDGTQATVAMLSRTYRGHHGWPEDREASSNEQVDEDDMLIWQAEDGYQGVSLLPVRKMNIVRLDSAK